MPEKIKDDNLEARVAKLEKRVNWLAKQLRSKASPMPQKATKVATRVKGSKQSGISQ